MERLAPLPLVNPVSNVVDTEILRSKITSLEHKIKSLECFILDMYIADFNQTTVSDVLKYESIEDIIEHVVTSKIEIHGLMTSKKLTTGSSLHSQLATRN